MPIANAQYDLAVIGGGINGVGIARDAAGRGLRVLLCEQDDLASHTSSASTKLIHGGLRYLEQRDFRLVRESLLERERLLHMAPNIIWPQRFVLPHDQHLRPAWMVRIGLFLYDHLGGHQSLERSGSIDLRRHPVGAALDPRLRKGFVYSDCCVRDARLVVLTAMDARKRGATILTRTRCEHAVREGGLWRVDVRERESGTTQAIHARCLVNAAGPWAGQLFGQVVDSHSRVKLRLVKGSHIVVPRMFDHHDAYILQQPDRRIVFAIPYQYDYTLIGTTDQDYQGDPAHPSITPAEIDYLCAAVNRYVRKPIQPSDVVWSYSGVRPLQDDGHGSAAEVTREYVLDLDANGGNAPMLSVYGGKVTTHRRLAEQVLEKLRPLLGFDAPDWTAKAPLPGGDIANADCGAFVRHVRERWPWLPAQLARRLAHSYGTRIERMLGTADSLSGLGACLGADLYEREVEYLVDQEWARTTDDILWRRTKLGLRFDEAQRAALETWLQQRCRVAA